MISEQARTIRDSLQIDSLDQDVQTKRAQWEAAAKQVPTPLEVTINEHVIGGVRCMLHTPNNTVSANELILYVHGGGLVEGSIHTSREWCARLSKACGTLVLSVNYRLAPEHPYPAALNDVVSVYSSLNEVWPAHVVSSMGADSSGCALLLAALFKIRSIKSSLPGSVFLLSPSVDFSFTSETLNTNKSNDPMVSRDVLEHYAKLYAGHASLTDPSVSPLNGSFEHFPPMCVLADAGELLFDDAIRLQSQAQSDGCVVDLFVAEGLWHVWPTFGDFPESREATSQIARHIAKYRVRPIT